MNNKNNPTISICNIVKNEEDQIEGFLISLVDFADEIVVVDTGSSDKTLDIIEKFKKKYPSICLHSYSSEGRFHYGMAKNFSIKQATKDYIIILDTDERLSLEFKNNINKFLTKEKPQVSKIKRMDEYVSHLVDFPERIIKNNQNIFYKTGEEGRVHETLNHSYKTTIFEIPVWHCQRWNHYAHRPQRIFFQLELEVERTPKVKSFMGHVIRGVWYFFFRFKKLYFKQGLHKDGSAGFKYSFMRSLDAFLIEFFVGLKPKKDYRYWEDSKYHRN